MSITQKIRPPVVAGMFYDESPSLLRKKIEQMLEKARKAEVEGEICGIVSPHAGYIYSGFTAASVYKLVKGKQYECVIVIAPSHREYFDGISIYPGKAYQTPLGDIPINNEIRNELAQNSDLIVINEVGHRSEHSAEVQLPFLQVVLGDFNFVPLVMGNQSKELCYQLSESLYKVIGGKNVLLVASSDLSHYHPAGEAELLDKRVIQAIENFDADEFYEQLEDNFFEACGGGPIAVVMRTSKLIGAKKSKVIHYCNSGDVTGDRGAVVGYLSAVFLKTN